MYVNANSNHPPVVNIHLPKNIIPERLASISYDKEEFYKLRPIYEVALKKTGFDGNLSFIDPATRNNKRKRIRKNIIWYDPALDQNVTTNVTKRFILFIDKHFPKGHSLHKLFYRNTLVSYGCMNNMAFIIFGQNAKVLKCNTEVNNGGKECRKRDEYALKAACLIA